MKTGLRGVFELVKKAEERKKVFNEIRNTEQYKQNFNYWLNYYKKVKSKGVKNSNKNMQALRVEEQENFIIGAFPFLVKNISPETYFRSAIFSNNGDKARGVWLKDEVYKLAHEAYINSKSREDKSFVVRTIANLDIEASKVEYIPEKDVKNKKVYSGISPKRKSKELPKGSELEQAIRSAIRKSFAKAIANVVESHLVNAKDNNLKKLIHELWASEADENNTSKISEVVDSYTKDIYSSYQKHTGKYLASMERKTPMQIVNTYFARDKKGADSKYETLEYEVSKYLGLNKTKEI